MRDVKNATSRADTCLVAIASYAQLLLVLALSALLSGCGGSPESPGAFLAREADGAVFIQWTRSGDSVTGSITVAHHKVGDDGYATVERTNVSVNGVIDGSDITLTLDRGLGADTNWNGTLKGDELTLSFASDEGSLETLHFKAAAIEAYNEAVADVQRSVAAANDVVAQVEAEQAQAEADAEAAEVIDSLTAAVTQDLSALEKHLGAAQTALAAVPGSLDAEQAALDRTYAALQKTLASGPDDRCYEAGGVDYEAGGVDYEKGGVEYDLDTVNSELAAIDEALARLRDDFSSLEAALSSSNHNGGDWIPTQDEVADARASAKAAVTKIIQTGRGYRRKTNSTAQTAHSYAAQAQRACG